MAFARICPSCQGEFGPEVEACPRDGRRLVSLPDAEQRLIGRTLDGKYTLQSLLGRGGIGVVFRARQHSMERSVALKVLRRGLLEDETAVRRFLREVQGAGRVMHPNTVTAFDFGQTDEGELYLVMELLEGRTLGEILAAEGRLAPERVVALLAGICDGLHAAHEAGVVHRDVKPENILVLPDTGPTGEFVKVVDFGLAQLKSVQGAESITKTGAICGTPAYMSPEQALDRPMDRRTDLYSLGVVAWQLLVGCLPFTGDSPMRLLLAHLHEAPPPLALRAPWVPPALASVVMEALAKNPDDRPPTAAEFKRRLLAAVGRATAGPSSGQLAPGGHAASQLAALTGHTLAGQPTQDGSLATLDGSVPGAPPVVPPSGAVGRNASETDGLRAPPPSVEVPVVEGAGPRWARWIFVAAAVAALATWGVRSLRDEAPSLPPMVPDSARVTDAAPAAAPVLDAAPASVAPVSAAPVSATPVSATPVSVAPVSATPVSAAPVSAAPVSVAPVSVAPPTDTDADLVWIHSRPPGAEVRLDGRLLGTTPIQVPRPAAAVRLQLRLARHEVRTLRLDPQRTPPLVTLRRLPEIVE